MNAAAADIPMATSEETVNTVSPVRVMARSPFRPTMDDNTGTETRRSGPFGERGVFPGQRWKTRTEAASSVRGGTSREAPTPTCPAEAPCGLLREGGSSRKRAKAGGRRRRSPPRQRRLADLGDNREVRIDDVGDFVLRGLPHERLRAAFSEPIVGHQPSLQLARRVLEGLEQRTRAAEDHDVRGLLEPRPADRLL